MEDCEFPLTSEEIHEIRKILESERRVAWFWANLRYFGAVLAAIIASVYAIVNGYISFDNWRH